jgi:hypothetical protein
MSAFRSGRAVVIMATVAVVWLTARIVALRFVRRPLATAALFGVGALAILKVVVLPAYQNHTVVEALPEARLVRVMPNTPCLIGQGASAYCLGPKATPADSI